MGGVYGNGKFGGNGLYEVCFTLGAYMMRDIRVLDGSRIGIYVFSTPAD
jgi:hypothetical protein